MIEKMKGFIFEHKFCFLVFLVFIFQCVQGSYRIIPLFLLRQITFMLFMTIGASIEMMSGDVDLAFAAQISFSTVMAATLIVSDLPIVIACLIIFLLNALLGCLKGFLLVKIKIPSIIYTLALQMILLNFFAGTSLENNINFSDVYSYSGSGELEIIFTFILIGTVGIFFVFINKTYYGKYCRILGENIELAQKSGLNCTAIAIIIHVVASLCFSISAIEIMLYTSSGNIYMGANYLYKVLTAVCLGGIGYKNGKGSVGGVVIGSLTMVFLLLMLTADGYLNRFETIIEGGIILLTLGGNKFKN